MIATDADRRARLERPGRIAAALDQLAAAVRTLHALGMDVDVTLRRHD